LFAAQNAIAYSPLPSSAPVFIKRQLKTVLFDCAFN